jgi:hypothetical protein
MEGFSSDSGGGEANEALFFAGLRCRHHAAYAIGIGERRGFFGPRDRPYRPLCNLPMANADEDALRAAGPRVAVWIDRLRHAGHVVFVRKIRRGHKPNAGFRIDVDGRRMTVWELWARFRSELER